MNRLTEMIIDKLAVYEQRRFTKNFCRELDKKFPVNDYEVPVADLKNGAATPEGDDCIRLLTAVQNNLSNKNRPMHMNQMVDAVVMNMLIRPDLARQFGHTVAPVKPETNLKMMAVLEEYAAANDHDAPAVLQQYDKQVKDFRKGRQAH